ncbi:hydantoinase/oxoprolinase family protein [Chelatococcus sp. GCM10030263]|uniref:hydantoinase/oxoprolinase family protein n=1 Tax=Chelatococcus sp. GCM10030263 TaxID=3273387 RepID=UPI00360CF246
MYRIGVDVGGTFTDFVLFDSEAGSFSYFKVPSTPDDPSVAIAEGVVEMLSLFSVPPKDVSYFGHGTTVATNMIIERRGVDTGLVTTKGFRDVLAVGRQTRPDLYDYGHRRPDPLVERYRRKEVPERMTAGGEVLLPLDEAAVAERVSELKASGVAAVAVCFLHAYRNPAHEERVREIIARIAPDLYVSISSDVLPEFREFERTSTTVLNAYVGPKTRRYLHRLRERIGQSGITVEPMTFHSNGGLLPVRTVEHLPVLTCLSGPAAGVVGSAAVGKTIGCSEIITFDVGGTSTDVSLITEGRPRFTSNRLVAGYPVKMPMVDIHVIGAGGGSIAAVDEGGALKVGPVSAGASPGPVAYGKGGTKPTLTDANIVLGRLNPVALLDGRMPVDREAAARAIETQIAKPLGLSLEEAAYGILRIATANMSRAIRAVTIEHGHDLGDFTLFAFGGAGPLHAADVAVECGIRKVVVPQEPGTLCARGILLSDISRDFVRTLLAVVSQDTWPEVVRRLQEMVTAGDEWLEAERIATELRSFQLAIDARYVGQSHDIRVYVEREKLGDLAGFMTAFHHIHRAEFGYDLPERKIEVVNCRVQAVGFIQKGRAKGAAGAAGATLDAALTGSRHVYVGEREGWVTTPVYRRSALPARAEIPGPAIIEEMSGTTVVLPGQTARLDEADNVQIAIS